MENFFYYYEILYFDEMSVDKENYKGITYGDTIINAIKNLQSYYGDENILDILHFKCINDGGECVEISEVQQVIKDVCKQRDKDDRKVDTEV